MIEQASGWTGPVARRLAGLFAACVVLLCAAPPAARAAGGAAQVSIDTVSPVVAGPNDTVRITGTVTDSAGSPLKGARVGIREPAGGRPLRTRSDIALAATRTALTGQDGTESSAQQPVGDLGGGQSRPFTLQVRPADLRLSGDGVYELAVDVSSGDGSRQLGIARTFLPYATDPTPKPTQVATLWPLIHAPELVAQTMSDNEQTPVLRDDSLAAELAPGGRLDQLVTIGSKLPGLTWVVDPDLLDTVYAMTKPYRVQKPHTSGDSARDDNTVPGAGKDAATAWLAKLRTAVAANGDEVVALPYADPDLASIAHNGAGLPGMATALQKAGTAGQVTAEGRLSTDVRTGVAWPYQGMLDQQTATVARTAGDGLVLVDGASMPDSGSLSYTPGAPRSVSGGQTTLVADHTVSEPFQADLTTVQARTAAEQRFLAETMMITREQPGNQRTLLVMPPRELTAGTAQALADGLQAAQTASWVSQVKLDTVAAAAPDPRADASVPGDYPGQLRGSELSASALGGVMSVQGRLDQLMLILTQPQRVRGPFSAAMARSMSTGWRGRAPAAADYRTGVHQYLENLVSAVWVPKKTVVTLPGDNATLLISVKNDLNQAVGNLQLRLSSGQPNRLDVVPPVEDVVLDATTSRTFRFPARAQVNGSVQMTAQLWTTGPGAHPYGAPVPFSVEVTSVASGVTWVISAGAVLMALAGLRFYLQRKKRAAATDAALEDREPAAGDEKVGS